MSLFKQLSKIDSRTKYSVYGWIKSQEKQLKLRDIPSMISALCILYFRDDEIFDIISKKEIQLSHNHKVIHITIRGVSVCPVYTLKHIRKT